MPGNTNVQKVEFSTFKLFELKLKMGNITTSSTVNSNRPRSLKPRGFLFSGKASHTKDAMGFIGISSDVQS